MNAFYDSYGRPLCDLNDRVIRLLLRPIGPIRGLYTKEMTRDIWRNVAELRKTSASKITVANGHHQRTYPGGQP